MFEATSAKKALAHAKRQGRESQHSYKGGGGSANVRVDFPSVLWNSFFSAQSAEKMKSGTR